jgi:hypothetical protein
VLWLSAERSADRFCGITVDDPEVGMESSTLTVLNLPSSISDAEAEIPDGLSVAL